MKWYLVRTVVNPTNQLVFDFHKDGYIVHAQGENEEDCIARLRKVHDYRDDLEFIVIQENDAKRH